MGYISDVVLKIKSRYVLIKPELFDTDDEDCVWDSVTKGPEITICQFNGKWYEGYHDIDAVVTFLRSIPDEVYGFIRIGEELGDTEQRGDTYEYDMYITQNIEY